MHDYVTFENYGDTSGNLLGSEGETELYEIRPRLFDTIHNQ